MATLELRPMGIGDILDVTFRLYRRRFLTFLLIALIVYVPYALLLAAFRPFEASPQPPVIREGMSQEAQMEQLSLAMRANTTRAAVGLIGLAVFLIVLMPLCTAALTHNISASYLGEDLTAGQSYGRAAPRLAALIGTQLLSGLIIFAGLLLCLVPGIIFALWFMVIAPVVILEAKAGPSAMGRSKELMRGNLDKGFTLGFVVGILTYIITFGLNTLTALVPWPHPSLGIFAQTVLLAIILPLQTAPWILLYYDLRIRKEAFDLEKLAETLGRPSTGEPAAT